MNIQQFVSKAQQGGWNTGSKIQIEDSWGISHDLACQILLDALAWAAVGKAIGKTNIHGGLITMCRNCSVESGANSLGSCDYCGGHEWGNFQLWDRYSMHRFIDSLCDGLTLEEALKRATS